MSQLYVNPIELLDLANTPLADLDTVAVKKARRRLLTDLELGDGYILYHGQQLDRSACEQAWTDLNNTASLGAWHRLAAFPALSKFLGTGQVEELAKTVSQYTYFINDRKLIALIEKHFVAQYDKLLITAFNTHDALKLKKLAELPRLYSADEQPNAYRSVRSALHKQIADVKRQTEEFADTDDPQEVSDNIGKALGMRYWPEVPNSLANEQLQGAWSELYSSRSGVRVDNMKFPG